MYNVAMKVSLRNYFKREALKPVWQEHILITEVV